jgi:hypothetical protein
VFIPRDPLPVLYLSTHAGIRSLPRAVLNY